MKYAEIQEKLFELARVTYELEELYIENDGEVTEDTEDLERQKTVIADLLNGEGLDDLGRWLKSKEDEMKTLKAEKDAVTRRIKSVENTIEFVKGTICSVMRATGCEKAKGVFYSFTPTVSTTTKADTMMLKTKYQDVANRAIHEAGIPDYVTVKLDASVSLVPEGEDIPEDFIVTQKDTVRFTKPRGNRE